ncbi:hypothetical protein [Trichocoleus sp. DQ-U1]|uniref:hypothetical protein n=1 Tax=Trichocoleus sp. DQ-U1 TaxID=2933926 RepID=UPI0032997349
MANMKLSHLLSFSSLIPGLLIAQSPAIAVPGWAQTSRHLNVHPSSCTSYVKDAILKVTGSTATFDAISNTTFLMTAYPQGTTGVFMYCVSNPKPVCKGPTSTLLVVAFSDNGSGEAEIWRDALNNAVGDPVYIDCGTNTIEVP